MHPSIHRALVVEDDDDLRTALVRLLFRTGVDPLEANTAEKACELLRRERIDLVIADVHLGRSTAFELIDVSRGLEPTPVVIAISGRASTDEAFRLGQLGVSGYLSKPFSLNVLRQAVDSAFSEAPDLQPYLAATVGRVPMRQVQRQVRLVMVKQALARAGGNRSEAARLLHVTRQAIQQYLHAIDGEGGNSKPA